MKLALLFLSATAPALVVLWVFYRRDLHPEPKAVVLQTFLRGIVAVLPSCVVALGPYLAIKAWVNSPLLFGALYAFFSAALPEEFFKYRVLTTYSGCQPAFDEPMDGVVYGAAASLGFATVESLLYSASATWGIIVFRTFTALPAHACFGAIIGYYVGQARCNSQWPFSLWRGFAVAVVLHSLYDFPLLSFQKLQTQWPSGEEDLTPALWALMSLGAAALVILVSVAWTIHIVRRLRRDQEKAEMPVSSA